MKYRAYTLHNFREIPQVKKLPEEYLFDIEVVARVFPFKTNNYVVNELINWDEVPEDPIFRINFPQRGMLLPHHYEKIASLLRNGASEHEIQKAAFEIRMELNPHPAGQLDLNVPVFRGRRLRGVQHKYYETILFFPSQGQTCHAYCTFCFRWPQFVGMKDLKFAMAEIEPVIEYIKEHPEITDILFTGGDPMTMSAKLLRAYMEPLIKADIPHLQNIRIGTRFLTYWPYRVLTDPDADDILRLFEEIVKSGKHLSIMAHFNHWRELETRALEEAVRRIRSTGANIRTQSPLLNHINDHADVWSTMWKKQVKLGMIPYYMFVVRDTGAQHYFGLPLVRAWNIFRRAYQQVSGLARTVRGPSMSATPGKIHVLGVSKVNGEKVFVLQFLQGRNPDWVRRPFFAKYNERAIWIDELEPAFSDKFFFEDEMEEIRQRKIKELAEIGAI